MNTYFLFETVSNPELVDNQCHKIVSGLGSETSKKMAYPETVMAPP